MKKISAVGLLLVGLMQPVFGQDTAAIVMAATAGGLAGAARACGQGITEFNNRVNQALAVLAQNPTELLTAEQAYQNYSSAAFTKEASQRPVPCEKVLADFQQVPLMRPDYQTTVLTQLRPTAQPPSFLPGQQPPMEQAARNIQTQDYQMPTKVLPLNDPLHPGVPQPPQVLGNPNSPVPTATSQNPPVPPTPPLQQMVYPTFRPGNV